MAEVFTDPKQIEAMSPEERAEEARKVEESKVGFVKQCEAEKWSPRLMSCGMEATTEEQFDKCKAILEEERKASGEPSEYARKEKTSEAREFVKKMYDGARTYYMDPNFGPQGSETAPMFPAGNVGPTPPLGTCCEQGGKCQPQAKWWKHETWNALQFAVDDPHYYSYEYKVEGNASPGEKAPVDGSNNFTVFAYGDLDCDGKYSTFSMYGVVDEVYADGPMGSAVVATTDELE